MTEPNRELMRMALTAPRTITAEHIQADGLKETIDAARAALVPAKDGTEFERTASLSAIEHALMPIGAKVMPMAGEDQGKAWLVAVASALSDLPTRFVVQAARSALHLVFRFPYEAEEAVRTMAQELVGKQERAIALLECMKQDLERAAAPKTPAIEHTPTPPRPWTVERVLATPRYIIDFGLNCGFIEQAIVDEAFSDGMPADNPAVPDFAAQQTAKDIGRDAA